VSLVSNWRDRYPRPAGKGRVLILIALLIAVILIILNATEITRGFSAVFFPPSDTTGVTDE
jgi:hypothetical protein